MNVKCQILKAGFQHADFSASAEFFACADFSAFPHCNFHHNADCFKIQILEDLDKIKIENISNMKFSVMACKTSLLLLNKINVLLLAQRKRKMWVRKLFTERRTKGEFSILVQDLILFDHFYFFRMFRMNPSRFEELLSWVAQKNGTFHIAWAQLMGST